jgi:nicotinamidase-related amidase
MTLSNTALLICDMQNDFLHAEGAYGRAGLGNATIAALPDRILPLANALRAAGAPIIATQFTLVPGRGGAPLISPHLQKLRPFLAPGDFVPGAWGHQTVDALLPVDFSVEKIAYSAFYMTRLEWLLRRLGITTLLVAGIVTNGGVASTIRDAALRDFAVTVLEDGCAAFDTATHETAIAALQGICEITTIAAALQHHLATNV